MLKNAFPILMYHSISDMPRGTIMRSLHVRPNRFNFQMRLLKIFGYRGVSMTELKPYLTGEKSGKVIGLTFDDGYKNNLVNALPILKKLGFSATIYIVSNNIGSRNNWDIKKGIQENKTMDKNEIKEWIRCGMEIGAHTQNHTDLLTCNNTVALNEIVNSKVDLENIFNTKIDHFCYPYGSFSEKIISIVRNAGFETATSTIRGRSSINDNLLALPRVKITHHTLPHLFLLKLFSSYEEKSNK
jgi:peptidoglycan/xylan/chitin deacetylase (PgdA/CDA1 family)